MASSADEPQGTMPIGSDDSASATAKVRRRLDLANRRVAEAREGAVGRAWDLEHLRDADRAGVARAATRLLAHEIGTPLNIVIGRATLLAGGHLDKADLSANARLIVEQAREISAAVDRMLRLAGVEESRGCTTPVSDALREAAATVAPLAATRGIVVTRTPGELDERISGSAPPVAQVLTGLLARAIESQADGATVRLGVQAMRVAQPAELRALPGTYVRVVVGDGPGARPEEPPVPYDPSFPEAQEGHARRTEVLRLLACHGTLRGLGGWLELPDGVEGLRAVAYFPAKETP